ncbi:chromate transporter [Paenibacillus sp. WQ 127069]|uniref:Chromate transporter n=1 Tax=Paenibacillus baimaensis TaxID=2982185 RepID=A0ABT2U8B2_9BACL|nr:chromate transporter [Paenibacillus sp. WQ 127069]MCU6790762.1 chromate transporter [Paenibacillus sp. WQ 127069]
MKRVSWLHILAVSFQLGLTSFGGPAAHLGYFHEKYVKRKQWIDEGSYADLVALCQFLPGPASSKVGIGIGFMRGGVIGAIMAWIGFTLPSAVVLALFAYWSQGWDASSTGWLHGLKLAAVAIVAQAVWGMGKSLAPDRGRATIAILTTAIALLFPSTYTQLIVIIAAGVVGLMIYKQSSTVMEKPVQAVSPAYRRLAIGSLIAFVALLFLLPMLRSLTPNIWVAMIDSFYRTGALVFGGGHVVLPLLEQEIMPTGWLSKEQFLAGYGAAQAVPGPLFTFASYLGFMIHGWVGAVVATIAIFLPAFLLVLGALPFWNKLRKQPQTRGALTAINAAVVGILLAALYDPVWVSTVRTPGDFVMVLALFGALLFWKLPSWCMVILSIGGGMLLAVFNS